MGAVIQNNLDCILLEQAKGIDPIAVKYGGVYLYDYDGKRYIDFSSGLMNVNIDHGDRRITAAVVRQMQEISYATPSCVTAVRGELGKKLAAICPGDLNKALPLRMRSNWPLYTGRHKILSRYQSYHGSSIGANTQRRRVNYRLMSGRHLILFTSIFRTPTGTRMAKPILKTPSTSWSG